MDKSSIRNFAIEARKMLMKSAETEAGFYGVTKNECKSPIQKGNDFEVYETIAGTENRIYSADIKRRANLVKAVETLGFEQVIEETAYTWFNRIIAIRFMEVNDYLPTRVRVLSSETGSNTPDIVTQSLDVDLNMTVEEFEKVQKAKDKNRYDDAFRMLFIKQCNELNTILPGLFEKTDDYMELLLKLSYTSDGVVRMLVDSIDENNFNVETEGQVEIIGWMYQYYNTELKAEVFGRPSGAKIRKEDIPAATQLFTPDWIVRYMVENSVGRVWIEHLRALDDSVNEQEKAENYGWKYYLPEAEQEDSVKEKLVEIRKSYAKLEPKDITCIDPCMGSGHILVYMFDVLMDIYRSEGFNERDAVFSILENNIRGLDIDKRAYQLSYFALMMKARRYNRTFFRGKQDEEGNRHFVEPLVLAVDESNNLNRSQLKYFGVDLDENENNNAINQIVGLLDDLVDAKELGSIINVDQYDWKLLRKFCQNYDVDGQISFDTYGIDKTRDRLSRLVMQGEIMANKYCVVATNPPYMGISNGSGKLCDYAKEYYADSKTDMFAVFIEKCSRMLSSHGYQSMITQHSWMFLVAYEKLRGKMLNSIILNMIHLGARAFEEISGEVVQTTSWIMTRENVQEYKGTYSRLVKGNSQKSKEEMFLDGLHNYITKQDKFEMIPGTPIAYWASENIIRDFVKGDKLSDVCQTRKGLATSDNNRFLRLWFEVEKFKISFLCCSNEDTEEKWYPINKGGGFRRWYGNRDYIINWEHDGYEIRNFRDKNGKLLSRPQNTQYNFKQALTWSKISTADFSARFCEGHFLFDDAAAICHHEDEKTLKYVLAFLNSKTCQEAIKILNPTLNIQIGDIGNLPILIDEDDELLENVDECIALTKEDWDSFETSWDFKKHPLMGKGKIADLYGKWCEKCEQRKSRLSILERKIDTRISDIYLIGTMKDESDMYGVSISTPEIAREIKSLISYAVGCMFGRYSLDVDGLVFAGGTYDASQYATWLPDADGIIPITDADYFDDDIVTRFINFISYVYGSDYLVENLRFVAMALDTKGDTDKEKIRNYFISDF